MHSKQSTKPVIALFPAHPAQVWILQQLELALAQEYQFIWFIRDKDISIQLADELSIQYLRVSKARKGFLGNSMELIANIFRLYRYTNQMNVDLWISKYGAAHIISKLLSRKSIFFVDDDFEVVPNLYRLSCNAANSILLPEVTDSGPYETGLTEFDSFFELMYLHPSRFTPNKDIFKHLGIGETDKYAIVRLASLTAHHDAGAKGVSAKLLSDVITMCKAKQIRIFITGEESLSEELKQYRLKIPISEIHHALYYAEFILGDSQTMTSEAALLGTPAFRINSFVGRISYIGVLENYKLAFGFKPGEEARLLNELDSLLQMSDRNSEFQRRRMQIISDKVDPLPIFVDAIDKVLMPESRT